MLRETLSILVFCALVITSCPASSCAQSKNEAKIKQKVIELGMNKNVRVELKDDDVVDGRISEIRETELSIQPAKKSNSMRRDIRYEDIRRISARSHIGRNIAIGVGAALLIINIAFRA